MLRSTRDVLLALKRGKISLAQAEKLVKLDALSIVDELARLDLNRHLRRGVPEVVYARGKTDSQLRAIILTILNSPVFQIAKQPLIVSKVSLSQAAFLSRAFKKKQREEIEVKHFKSAAIFAFIPKTTRATKKAAKKKEDDDAKLGRIALISAGTSDIAILNEAEVLLQLLGCETIRFNDAGVAALRRLAGPLKEISEFDPDAIIVAAGMEGALPSLVAGLASVPVIGLPTSIGYGLGKGGEAALMSMLQACPLGLCVVNIDGGVAAGIIAWLIAQRVATTRSS